MENVSSFPGTGAEWLDLEWRGVCYSCLILFVLVVLLMGRMHVNVRRLEQMDEMEQTRRWDCLRVRDDDALTDDTLFIPE
jgi:hypothetical protein